MRDGTADPATWLEDLRRGLATGGLNHLGVVGADRPDAVARPEVRSTVIAPGARSVVVVASGGAALWEAMISDLREHPRRFLETEHPLDAFVRRVVGRVTSGQPHPWCYAAWDAALPLDFRTLAVLAGLGAPSRLGLVIHPRWGPWMGLRAACFVPFELPETGPSPDVCGGCAAPCERACPGQAFVEGRWEVERCSSFHQVSDACSGSCASREACPVGTAYPPLERLYHDDRAAGRRALRAALGVPEDRDPRQGSGPCWGAWAAGGR